MKKLLILLLSFLPLMAEITLEVLGSGGPELSDRASASYLIKKDGRALILIDFGGGAFLRFHQAKANLEDLEAVLITHLHIDHVVDLPALMKAGYFSKRSESLYLIGPKGNKDFPSFTEYMQLQFGKQGAYRYMADILTDKSDSFSLDIHEGTQTQTFNEFSIKAVEVNHGVVPALAYRIEIENRVIVFSGDTTATSNALIELAKDADLLIAHHAITEHGCTRAKTLHMTPSRIAEVAHKADVKNILLSHRMTRTYGHEKETKDIIRQNFNGNIYFAKDLMKINLP